MQGHEGDVVALVEDLLGAVAVVIVDVEDGDPRTRRRRQVVGDDRRVVEEAVPAIQRHRRVVTRWPAQPVGDRLATDNGGGGREGDVDRRAGSPIGALGDRRRRLVAPPPEARRHSQRLANAIAHPRPQTGHGEHVGDDVVGRADLVLVLRPRRGEETHEAGIVDRLDRRRPPLRRLGDVEAAVVEQCRQDQLGALRVLERCLERRRLQFTLGVVQTMQRRREGAHRHAGASRGCERRGASRGAVRNGLRGRGTE